jgi:hypothetical protein
MLDGGGCTRPDFLLAASASFLEFIHSINGDENLDSRDGIEHVGVMAWCCAEAAIVALT